jgi:hypothetical protein
MSVESVVMSLLEMRGSSKLVLSEDTIKRISSVRDRCMQAESSEGNEGLHWRRGTSYKDRGAPNKWRQGPGPPQKPAVQDKHVGRYVSKFQNTDAPVEEKILNQNAFPFLGCLRSLHCRMDYSLVAKC